MYQIENIKKLFSIVSTVRLDLSKPFRDIRGNNQQFEARLTPKNQDVVIKYGFC